ncbi:MAG TPA: hypothetical protein VIF57_32525 [Polyangia bacterium]|jgi:hypothetical protein
MNGRNLARAAAIAAMLAGTSVGLGVGCGGGGGGKTVTEADFCAQKADAECQVTDRCVSDKTMCKTQRTAVCTAFASAAKASGTRTFVAGNVGDCINKTKSAYGKSTITPADMASMDEACNYVFQGKGAVNVDSCDVKYDCANKVICDKGLCATSHSVSAGCSNPGDVCPSNNYCAQNASQVFVCMAKGMSGATCDANTPCIDSLRCSAGSCTDRVPLAGNCTSNDDCATAAPFCDPYAGNKCDQGLSFASGSASCADYGGTASPAGAGGAGGGAGGSGGAGGRGGAGGSAGGGGTGGGGGSGTGGSGGGNQDAATD